MAGPFTHWMVVEELLENVALAIAHQYFDFLRGDKYKPYVLMGAVGPDYPYLTGGTLEGFSWADQMHYHATDGMIRRGLKGLAGDVAKASVTEDFKIKLAWLFGYAAHVVTDCVIHPVVNDAVGGPYSKITKDEHRHCEMIQDVYIFNKLKKQELITAGYPDILKKCSVSGFLNPAVKDFWENILKDNYPPEFDTYYTSMPGEWHENYMRGLDLASIYITSRHAFLFFIGLEKLAYKQITAISAEETAKFITNIPSPSGGDSVTDFDQAFRRAIEKVRAIWINMLADLDRLKGDSQANVGGSLQAWNLDTGKPNNSDVITFWA